MLQPFYAHRRAPRILCEVYPFSVQPVTLNSSTAAFQVRLLYATRFLQIPEGRAFLLDQIRRRIDILPLKNSALPNDAQLETRYRQAVAALNLGIAVEPSNPGAKPPELEIKWPSETPPPRLPIYVYEQITNPEQIVIPGNLFELLI